MIGIILAGGRASRMGGGGHKGLRLVGGVPILERVVAALRPQCERLVLNAAAGDDAMARFGLPVVADEIAGHQGPLAGILAALDHVAETYPTAPFAVTVPTDTPFLPGDLVARLQDARVADRAEIACAASGETVHPVIALWTVALRDDLRRAVVDRGTRRLRDVLANHAVAHVTWPTEPVDPFFNVNTPADLAAAEALAQRAP